MEEYEVRPAHIAIIMDGNGRWARSKGLPRSAGHRAGVEAFRRTVRTAADLEISWLTVYAFSSENWSRPRDEVNDLMALLKHFIRRDLAELNRNGVRIRVIGSREGLSPDIVALLNKAETLTAANSRMNLVVAFNYGSRDEILRAARMIAEKAIAGSIDPATLTQQDISANLDTAGIPDPDLIIRTGGEQRLSNFLLWQAAYSEFVFLPCHWPDFGEPEFLSAVESYQARERRFGSLIRGQAS